MAKRSSVRGSRPVSRVAGRAKETNLAGSHHDWVCGRRPTAGKSAATRGHLLGVTGIGSTSRLLPTACASTTVRCTVLASLGMQLDAVSSTVTTIEMLSAA